MQTGTHHTGKVNTHVLTGAQGSGFIARDLTIENTAGPEAEQAVALLSNSNHSVVFRCEIKGYQDTLLAENHLQFYRDCQISGTIDVVFGDATAVFQNCVILLRRPLESQHNIITAQGRKAANGRTGFSFQGCNVTTREDLRGVETYLGRPWKGHSHVVFMQSYMDAIVHPAGWVPWKKDLVNITTTRTVFYGEYKNEGPGADLRRRVRWPGFHIMKHAAQALEYTVEAFINGGEWLPDTGVAYKPGL
jgi:pectinesterase